MKLKYWVRRELRHLRKRAMWGLAFSFLYVALAVASGAWLVFNEMDSGRTVTEDVMEGSESFPTISAMSPSTERFIGIDEFGRITLYSGPPKNGQVIQTFYQIKIDYFESKAPTDAVAGLYNGIKVNNPTELNSLLSIYRSYAVHR